MYYIQIQAFLFLTLSNPKEIDVLPEIISGRMRVNTINKGNCRNENFLIVISYDFRGYNNSFLKYL